MRKKFSILLFFVLCTMFYALPVKAISPALTPTVTPTAVPTGSIDEKIQQIREEVKKKVREKIEQTKKGTKAAYFGEITEITDSTLTLKTLFGEKSVKATTDSAIIGKSNKAIKFESLEIGSFAICMGYLADENLMEAKRILILTKPKTIVREVIFGRVTDISADEKIITVKNEKKNLLYMVEVTNKTIVTKKLAGSIKKVKFADIAMDDRLVTIGTPTENEEKIIVAKLIHVIPGLALGQEKPTKTPTPTTTP